MSQLYLTATVTVLFVLAVFGLANYAMDGRPFHAPMPTPLWAEEADSSNFITLEDRVAPKGVHPAAHRTQ
jgi:hypothetical protein